MDDHIDSRLDPQKLGEILSAFRSSTHLHLEDMDEENPLAKIGRECQELFTSGVIVLRKSVPVISSLMADVWDIYHYRHVVMAIGPNVPSLSISVVQDGKGIIHALTFAPYAWPQMAKEDPSMELGAILSIGSQVVDYYNDKLLSKEDSKRSKERALSYEAEYLRLIKLGGATLNGYQEDVLTKYPNGFDPSFAYPRRAVVAPGFA
jgi:hypothetical protein